MRTCLILTVISIHVPWANTVMQGEQETILTSNLKKRYSDFVPRVIVDVGANVGSWTTAVLQTFPDAKMLMIEASPDKEKVLEAVLEIDALKNKEIIFMIAVLGATINETVQFFQGGDTGNSMFRENTKFYDKDVPVERNTSTLDTEIEKSPFMIEDVDYIKIDVQGAELMVLEGAKKVLAYATFVQFETGPIEYNTGGACFYQVDEIMRRHGFYLYDIGDIAHHPMLFKTLGAGQFDVLYARPSSPRLPRQMKFTNFCGVGRNTTSSSISSIGKEPCSPQKNNNDTSELESERNNQPFIFGFISGVFSVIAGYISINYFFRFIKGRLQSPRPKLR